MFVSDTGFSSAAELPQLHLQMYLAIVIICLLGIWVHPSCSHGQSDLRETCKDQTTCREQEGQAPLPSLLQKVFKREEKSLFDVAQNPGELSEDDIEKIDPKVETYWGPVPCAWTPAPACQSAFSYKGIEYTGCSDIDHPTPWCSHDTVHNGAWSLCTHTCNTTAVKNPLAQPSEAVTSGWVIKHSDHIGLHIGPFNGPIT